MSLYLLLADIHAADKAPASCTESYMDDLMDLIMQTGRVAYRREAAAVVWAGDVFHSKAPNRTSHRLVQAMIGALRSYPCPVFIVPGNHDIRNDRLASIRETQPLGVLFEAGAATRLEGWAPGRWVEGFGEEPMGLYGVPWLQGYGNWGDYDGEDPHPPIELNLAKALEGWRQQVFEAGTGSARPLVVTHAPLYPPGRELEWEHFPAERWAEAMGGAGAVFYGHVHPCHGIYEAGGVTFCNMGALSRGSLTESDLTRDVYCTLYDDQTGEFEPVKLNAKPADQVFRLKEKQQVTDMQGRLDAFLEDIGHAQLEILTPQAVIAHARSLPGVGREELALIEELLAGASGRNK